MALPIYYTAVPYVTVPLLALWYFGLVPLHTTNVVIYMYMTNNYVGCTSGRTAHRKII
jgi:hypothetical protein